VGLLHSKLLLNALPSLFVFSPDQSTIRMHFLLRDDDAVGNLMCHYCLAPGFSPIIEVLVDFGPLLLPMPWIAKSL